MHARTYIKNATQQWNVLNTRRPSIIYACFTDVKSFYPKIVLHIEAVLDYSRLVIGTSTCCFIRLFHNT